jgi:hypothetical protein
MKLLLGPARAAALALLAARAAAAPGEPPLRGRVSFTLKTLAMRRFSIDMPADFVDLLESNSSRGEEENAGEENRDPRFRRWVWGGVNRSPGPVTAEAIEEDSHSCMPPPSEMRLLRRSPVENAFVQGFLVVCSFQDAHRRPIIGVRILARSRKQSAYYSVGFYTRGLRYDAKAQAFFDRIAVSLRESPAAAPPSSPVVQ